MLFDSNFRGKIIINLEEKEGLISSHIVRKGIARKDRAALSAVLATYISMCEEAGKDPERIMQQNMENLKKIIRDRETG